MVNSTSFQDPQFLKNDQYRDSSNLDARAELHRRFSTAVTPWQQWVFQQLDLQPGSRILECGCGPGWLWRSNLDALPPGCHITLTDLSDGMAAEAQAALAASGHNFRFRAADIQDLPFADDSFDVVIANHMLYHVPDHSQALGEVRRVLAENGRFYAATNGRHHLQELWQIAEKLFPDTAAPLTELRAERGIGSFQLENGMEQLTAVFPHVTLHLYEDSLEVTEAAPLIAYLRSTSLIQNKTVLTQEKEAQLRRELQEQINRDGAIHITKETGLFVSW
ncbi:MAG TPA: class I SAM-dependent methyltransferase [Anaerolineae bacterium]|nr:class I SAM-dependent methyltransferase [Anaerolineae bacterium]